MSAVLQANENKTFLLPLVLPSIFSVHATEKSKELLGRCWQSDSGHNIPPTSDCTINYKYKKQSADAAGFVITDQFKETGADVEINGALSTEAIPIYLRRFYASPQLLYHFPCCL